MFLNNPAPVPVVNPAPVPVVNPAPVPVVNPAPVQNVPAQAVNPEQPELRGILDQHIQIIRGRNLMNGQ